MKDMDRPLGRHVGGHFSGQFLCILFLFLMAARKAARGNRVGKDVTHGSTKLRECEMDDFSLPNKSTRSPEKEPRKAKCKLLLSSS